MHHEPRFTASVVRCDPALDRQAFELAAGAFPEAERLAYEQGVRRLLESGHSDHVVLLVSYDGDQLSAAQLGQSLPGRAAAVWPPQFRSGIASDERLLARSFFDRIAAELVVAGAHLAQALLHPKDQKSAELFALGGFEQAAELLYLAANLDRSHEEHPQLPFEVESFLPGQESRLAKVIDRTYVGTLDCPQLDGLRQTADVIAGYQSVGEFRSDLWLLARHENDDVGCLLLNLHPEVRHAEIVYVALVPEVRGRGWGGALTELALWIGRRAVAERIVLAVDSTNAPAIRMYRSLGFFEFDRRAVWIRQLPTIPN